MMNVRTKFLTGLYAICLGGGALIAIISMSIPRHPATRWIPLVTFVTLVLPAYWWILRFRGRLPKPSSKQLSKTARSVRNLGIFFIVAPVLGYLTDGPELLALPYKLGFVIPLIPLSLAIYFLRISARLRREIGEPETGSNN